MIAQTTQWWTTTPATTRRLLLIAPFVVAWISAVALVSATAAREEAPRGGVPAHASGSAPEIEAQAQAPAGGYVGADTCVVCHSDREHLGAHDRTVNPATPMAGQGCESCHGPGQAHVDAGGDPALIQNPATMSPLETSATCTACHNRGETAFWNGSQHDGRSLTCTTCHAVHDSSALESQLKAASVTDTCGSCHRDKLAKLDRSGHMPVREGKLECVTCHNPHGTQNVRLLRVGNTINDSCTSCHAEKRGPFLWEHAPVVENCATCHDPHGTANDRSLVAKLPFLCQRCHSHTRHPSTIYDNSQLLTSNRLYTRGCVNCHSSIHGSNHPSGHTFTR